MGIDGCNPNGPYFLPLSFVGLASAAAAKLMSHFFSYVESAGANIALAKQSLKGLILLASLFVFMPSFGKYIKFKGSIDHEFRIAEDHRAIGSVLNRLPSRPTLGVIAAGGIARTYDGHIFDLMGLNWTTMAHANRTHNSAAVKNHAAFSKEIFFEYQPDIVIPLLGCKYPILNTTTS